MERLEFNEENEWIEKVRNFNGAQKPKYYILTMGCLLNENDSEKLCGMIEKMGYVRCENPQEAKLIVFNTCCIRENAEDKLFGKLGELKNYKRKTRSNHCNWWMYDATKTYSRKNC